MDNHTACVIKAAMNAVDSLHLEFKKNGYTSLAKNATGDISEREIFHILFIYYQIQSL